MPSTLPNTLKMNQAVPDFSLPDQTGGVHRLRDYQGKIVIVNFFSAECPWSERADRSLAALSERFPGQMVVLTIASNANESEALINEAIHQRGLSLVLRDADGRLADLWQAQTTPHVFVIDPAGLLRYRGAVDDVTFRKRTPEHFHVEAAVEAILGGRRPKIQETPPCGCTIVRL